MFASPLSATSTCVAWSSWTPDPSGTVDEAPGSRRLTEGVPRHATSASDAGVHVIGGDVTGPALVAGGGDGDVGVGDVDGAVFVVQADASIRTTMITAASRDLMLATHPSVDSGGRRSGP